MRSRYRRLSALAAASLMVAGLGGVFGGARVAGAAECNTIMGSPGDDTIHGTEGDDCIDGGAGNDTIDGLGGNDRIFGGPGDDTIRGGGGRDTLEGQEGDDTIYGGTVENDADDINTLRGGPGDDNLYGADQTDHMSGGLGEDMVQGFDGRDDIVGGIALGDQTNTEKFMGLINGEADGSDKLDGGPGNDDILGDNEQPSGPASSAGVAWSSRPVVGPGPGNGDTIVGGPGEDRLSGMDGVDTIDAGPGDDQIFGGNGADVLDGSEGQDIGYVAAEDTVVNIEKRCLDTTDKSSRPTDAPCPPEENRGGEKR